MSLFDRFSSQKGKAEKTAPKKKTAAEAKQESFAAVGAAKEPAKKAATKDAKESSSSMAVSTKATGHAHRILLQAMVTEKSSRLEKLNQYVFLVTKSATKQMVREAVDSVYGVRPIAVHMINLPGKWVRYGRTTGQQVGRRKAIVTLPAGKKIDVVSA